MPDDPPQADSPGASGASFVWKGAVVIAAADLVGVSAIIGVTGTTIALLWTTFRTSRKVAAAHEVVQATAATVEKIDTTTTKTEEAVNGIKPGDPTIRENVQQLVAAQDGTSVPVLEHKPPDGTGLSQMVARLIQDQAESKAALEELRTLLRNGGMNGRNKEGG